MRAAVVCAPSNAATYARAPMADADAAGAVGGSEEVEGKNGEISEQRQNLTSFLSKVRSRATNLFPEGGGEGTDATRERLDALLVVLQDRAADASIDENALLSRFREANPELANEEGLFNVIGDLSDEIGIGRDELDRIRNSAKAVIAKHKDQATKVLLDAKSLMTELIDSDEAKAVRAQLGEAGGDLVTQMLAKEVRPILLPAVLRPIAPRRAAPFSPHTHCATRARRCPPAVSPNPSCPPILRVPCVPCVPRVPQSPPESTHATGAPAHLH